jgi:UDP-2-acetamido-3-amino-2,3-dideoxy-glucuronate N-acetyltransferase
MLKNNIAVVGCGRWGMKYIPLLAECGLLAYVYDIDPSAARRALQSTGLDESFKANSWPMPDVDAVIIASPSATHFPLARDALLAGMHVLVEKPLAIQYADAQELINVATSANRILGVGHLLRYHPAVLQLKDMLASELLGDIKFIDTKRVGPATLREEHLLYSLMVHDIDLVLYLTNARPLQINIFQDAISSSDYAVVAIDFEPNWRATFTASWLMPTSVRELTVVGKRMIVQFDQNANNGQGVIRCYSHHRQPNGRLTTELVADIGYGQIDLLAVQLSDFVDAVNGIQNSRQRIFRTTEQAVQGIRLLDSALQPRTNYRPS